MSAEGTNGQVPVIPPPVERTERKIPPPPPKRNRKTTPRAVASDAVSFEEAGRQLGCSGQWIRQLVKSGRLRLLGTVSGSFGTRKVVSLAEARVAVNKVAGSQGSTKTKRKSRAKTKAPAQKGLTPFAKEEIRDFAQTIMEGFLDAISITIIARGDGTYDVSTTPRAPATTTFKV